MSELQEPILQDNKDRFVIFPIKHHDIWEWYKKSEASFWTAEEIDLHQDLTDWSTYGVTSAAGGIATIGASSNSGIFQNNIFTNGVTYTVTVNVTDSSNTNMAHLASTIEVPADSTLELAGASKLVLEATEKLRIVGAAASGDLEAFVSVLEIDN